MDDDLLMIAAIGVSAYLILNKFGQAPVAIGDAAGSIATDTASVFHDVTKEMQSVWNYTPAPNSSFDTSLGRVAISSINPILGYGLWNDITKQGQDTTQKFVQNLFNTQKNPNQGLILTGGTNITKTGIVPETKLGFGQTSNVNIYTNPNIFGYGVTSNKPSDIMTGQSTFKPTQPASTQSKTFSTSSFKAPSNINTKKIANWLSLAPAIQRRILNA